MISGIKELKRAFYGMHAPFAVVGVNSCGDCSVKGPAVSQDKRISGKLRKVCITDELLQDNGEDQGVGQGECLLV